MKVQFKVNWNGYEPNQVADIEGALLTTLLDGNIVAPYTPPDQSVGPLVEYNPPVKTATSGAGYLEDLSQSVTPKSSTTQQLNLSRKRLVYDSPNAVLAGGWVSAGLDMVETAPGSGPIDKIVASQKQLNLYGGNVTAAVLSETILGGVGASTNVTHLVFHYVPNLSAVPNINNVQNVWGFACDHYKSRSRNSGQWLKTVDPQDGANIMQEMCATHPGVVPNRYYFGAGARGAFVPTAMIAGVQYFVPFRVPERKSFTEIGLRVTQGIAASNMRLGIYHAVSGLPAKRILDSGDIPTAAAGIAKATINQSLEAGFYYLCVLPSAAITVNFIEYPLMELCGSGSDNGGETSFYAGPSTYAALPANATGLASISSSNLLPAAWLRST